MSASDYIATSGVPNHTWVSVTGAGYAGGDESGILQDNYALTIVTILDGTSNTMMVGELAGAPNLWFRGKIVDMPPFSAMNIAAGAVPQGTAWADSFEGENWVSGIDPNNPYNPAGGTCVMNCVNVAEYYSFHPQQCNFLFADGSVRAIAESTDPRIILEMITCRGGLPVQLP